jgi:hypothetical protein
MEQGGKKFNCRLRFALQGDGLGMMVPFRGMPKRRI